MNNFIENHEILAFMFSWLFGSVVALLIMLISNKLRVFGQKKTCKFNNAILCSAGSWLTVIFYSIAVAISSLYRLSEYLKDSKLALWFVSK